MAHAISLMATLAATWMLLSGYMEPLLLGFGILSCVIVYGIVARMDLIDHEAQYMNLYLGKWLRYVAWLAWQIVVSNIDVAKRVLHPKLPISPTVAHIPCSQKTTLGRVIFANSITLTPGTVSMDLVDGEIEVHALTKAAADQLHGGDMDQRIAALEKPIPPDH